MLNQLTHLKSGLVIPTDDRHVFRVLRSFTLEGSGSALDSFTHEVIKELSSLAIPFTIVDNGINDNPNVPFRGKAFLEYSSHYWITIRVDPQS